MLTNEQKQQIERGVKALIDKEGKENVDAIVKKAYGAGLERKGLKREDLTDPFMYKDIRDATLEALNKFGTKDIIDAFRERFGLPVKKEDTHNVSHRRSRRGST